MQEAPGSQFGWKRSTTFDECKAGRFSIFSIGGGDLQALQP